MILVTYQLGGREFDWLRSNNPKLIKGMVRAIKSRGGHSFRFHLT